MDLKQGDRLHIRLPEWARVGGEIVVDVQSENWAQATLVPRSQDVPGMPPGIVVTQTHRSAGENDVRKEKTSA